MQVCDADTLAVTQLAVSEFTSTNLFEPYKSKTCLPNLLLSKQASLKQQHVQTRFWWLARCRRQVWQGYRDNSFILLVQHSDIISPILRQGQTREKGCENGVTHNVERQKGASRRTAQGTT